MAEYRCFPTWEILADGVRDFEPSELPISPELAERINRWQARYDATFTRDDPASSGFSTEEARKQFESEGLEIWCQLSSQLGDSYEVEYFSELEGRIIGHPSSHVVDS